MNIALDNALQLNPIMARPPLLKRKGSHFDWFGVVAQVVTWLPRWSPANVITRSTQVVTTTTVGSHGDFLVSNHCDYLGSPGDSISLTTQVVTHLIIPNLVKLITISFQ